MKRVQDPILTQNINKTLNVVKKYTKLYIFVMVGQYIPVWRDHLAQKEYNTKMKITIVLLH